MKYTTGRKAALAAASLLPFLAIGLGTFLICNGTLLTPAICITYFLIPTVVITLFWLLIGSGWKTWIKTLLCLIILVVYVPVMFFAMICIPYSSSDRYTGPEAMEQYTAVSEKIPVLPAPDTLGNPQNQVYQYHKSSGLFLGKSHTLLCRYSPEDYAARVESLETDWVFQSEPLYNDLDTPAIPPEFTLDGFHFRFLSLKEESYDLWFPKYVALIGTNDETQEIGWLYWDFTDLDYFTRDVAEFLIQDCGWKCLTAQASQIP